MLLNNSLKAVKPVSPDTRLYTFDVPHEGEVPVSSFVVTRLVTYSVS
jgi:hypothetical protein